MSALALAFVVIVVIVVLLAGSVLAPQVVAAIIIVLAILPFPLAVIVVIVIVVIILFARSVLAPQVVATVIVVVAIVTLVFAPFVTDLGEHAATASSRQQPPTYPGGQQGERIAPGRTVEQARPPVKVSRFHGWSSSAHDVRWPDRPRVQAPRRCA